jgi:hypothetical protein
VKALLLRVGKGREAWADAAAQYIAFVEKLAGAAGEL